MKQKHGAINEKLVRQMRQSDLDGVIESYCQRANLAKEIQLQRPHNVYLVARVALTDCLWLKYGNKSWNFRDKMPHTIYEYSRMQLPALA